MSKKKPDYTKFMKRPAPLQMSAPTDRVNTGPVRGPIREEDIPWAEIVEVVEPGAAVRASKTSTTKQKGSAGIPVNTLLTRFRHVSSALAQKSARAVRVAGSPPSSEAPPLPVLALAIALFLFLL
ncbi:MAG: hypothetical protein RDU20_21150 [Desulfomonilaceae bacterium]|nr:hypothetical protein [Desulfomonilaceae bacterium]